MDKIIRLVAWMNDKLLWRLGIYLTNSDRNLRYVVSKYFRANSIEVVFDVGASYGQYGIGLRQSGYRGLIYSFEPLGVEFTKLEALAKADGRWSAHNIALGSKSEVREIYVSENSVSSSLIQMTNLHLSNAPKSRTSHSQAVEIQSLDHFIGSINLIESQKIHIKIDVQGFTKEVLLGSKKFLKNPNLASIEVELDLADVYFEQSDWTDILLILNDCGFRLFSCSGGFHDSLTSRILQLDAFFVRET